MLLPWALWSSQKAAEPANDEEPANDRNMDAGGRVFYSVCVCVRQNRHKNVRLYKSSTNPGCDAYNTYNSVPYHAV